MNYGLPHLDQLEAEAIHIIREVAAEFENPVLLYTAEHTYGCGSSRNRS